MVECIFCKIVKDELPAFKIYEDDYAIGILDIYPNIRGQSLVISKKHLRSYIFALDKEDIKQIMISTQKVAALLQRKLKVGRVNLAFEGTGVDHLHSKLYPAIGMNEEFREIIAEERIYFEDYPGYVTTLMGPRAPDDSLEAIQKEILSK